MQIIKVKKEKRKLKVKICGCTIYSKSIDKEDSEVKIKLLLNLIYFKFNKDEHIFTLRVFGFRFFQSKLQNSHKIFYLFSLPIWIKKTTGQFKNEFLDKILNKYDEYDDYYIFLSRSGEFYLLMHHFAQWLENNKSKNFILIFTAKYHLNICKMFFPHIPMVYVKKVNVPLVSRAINKIKMNYKSKTIYIPTCEKYFIETEDKIRNNNAHYYECLKQHLNLKYCSLSNFSISPETKNKINNIANYILNNNFIFISPETLSNEPMEKDFWENLCKKFRSLGYEVFCNSMEFRNLVVGTQSAFLTYEEAIELSKYAKAIIGLRSGFLECLSQSGVPLFAFYTDFPKRPGFKRIQSSKVLSGFSIKKLPNVNNEIIFEYDVNKYSDEKLIIDDVIAKLNKIKDTNKLIGAHNG